MVSFSCSAQWTVDSPATLSLMREEGYVLRVPSWTVLGNALERLGYQAEPHVELPRHESHGDAATPVAMQLAKQLGKPPRAIAEELIAAMVYDPAMIAAIEIAGPGFINFRLARGYYADVARRIHAVGERFGFSERYTGKRANVEYVSANPTGPLHRGMVCNVALGDSIARLLEAVGYRVTREYYFNNAGRQMQNLARSIYARYQASSSAMTTHSMTKMATVGSTSSRLPASLWRNTAISCARSQRKTSPSAVRKVKRGALLLSVERWSVSTSTTMCTSTSIHSTPTGTLHAPWSSSASAGLCTKKTARRGLLPPSLAGAGSCHHQIHR